MKIRSIELTNFRKFVGTVRVENIGDNVNVLVGRNELGKSTLLEAINGVIFEKAKSAAGHVRAFRHFVNGTVPEVKLAFDIDGKTWTIHKRFAGQAGKATLTCSDQRLFEDDAAEAELQRLLGFTGSRAGGEPGIWGTLWVQQGQSFGDGALDEQGQRTMQGCLEAQVGLVTGGTRGQKIPKAVREALESLRSSKGPRGKFKEAMERLAERSQEMADLETKRQSVFQHMENLARNKRELKQETDGWDDTAHRREVEAEQTKRTAAATHAAEIASATDAAKLARERATVARKAVDDRTNAIAELVPLELQLTELNRDSAIAMDAKASAKASVDAGEAKLSDLRSKTGQNAERARKLERVRGIVVLNTEIIQHHSTLDTAVSLEREAEKLSESIGAIAATDDAVVRIEEAVTELSAADAAMNIVATTVSFAIQEDALAGVLVDGEPLEASTASLPILTRTTITIPAIGAITVEPQIKNRAALITRRDTAQVELKAALEAAGVKDLVAARVAAAQRKEYLRRCGDIGKELANLAPGNRSKKLAAGLDALKGHLGELRGRLKVEMETCELATIPAEDQLTSDIANNHAEGARFAAEIKTAEAELAGPQDAFTQADKKLQGARERLAGLVGMIETKRADLDAGRSGASDKQLTAIAESLGRDAVTKDEHLAEKAHSQGETVEAIDARIKRLEGAANNHHRSIANLGIEVTRLTALIEANEGAGVEEMLLATEAERDRLASAVAEFEKEAAVLQLLLETLEVAEGEAKTRYLAPVVSRVEPYLKMLLPGANIVLDEDLRIAAIQRAGQLEDFKVLSGGTKEQLAVLTRLAFAELLLGQGRPATVILDDALAFSDDERIESMFDVLMRAGDKVQIIVLTCRKRLFTRLGAAPIEIREAV
jgi:energy-coupling factor transporter ATP-binding protein EcfA2